MSRDAFWVEFGVDDDEPDLVDDLDWTPVEGPVFQAVRQEVHDSLERISSNPDLSKQNWDDEVRKVSRRCLSSAVSSAKTAQLVLGRVQAGKTSNFTGVISLLADNNYRLFIVIAGVTSNLRKQTSDRLEKDLSVASNPGFEIRTSDPQRDAAAEGSFVVGRLQSFSGSQNSFAAALNKTLVYVVLKEDDHLSWFGKVLQAISENAAQASALRATHVAVIDDEVDQASPDTYTRHEDRVGAIHFLISAIRDLLPTHSYLGYTATPYANLLMSEGGALRCESVSVLSPGPDYVGAEELFTPHDNPYPRELFDWDFERQATPGSLKDAFAVFLAQTAIFNSDEETRSRLIEEPMLTSLANKPIVACSMLIHPHAQTVHATKVFEELTKLRASWMRAIATKPGPTGERDIAYVKLWEDYFIPAFQELGLLPSEVGDVLKERTDLIVEHCEIREINVPGHNRGYEFPTESEFSTKPAWVLIGGQLLDRGQTLPNLVTTYMPRPPGGAGKNPIRGNIDTLQQRGRFYGHRRQYQKLLRGWFDGDTLQTYREIARVEPAHIRAVQRLEESGLNIDKLMMIFELGAGNLNLVRNNVVPRETSSIKNSTWLFRQTVLSCDPQQASQNQLTLESLFSELNSKSLRNLGTSNATGRSNLMTSVRLSTLEGLLTSWVGFDQESRTLQICAELLSEYKDTGQASGDLILMSREENSPFAFDSFGEYRTARRLTSGNSAAGKTGSLLKITGLTSSNDAKFVTDGRVSIQIHFFDVRVPSDRAQGTDEHTDENIQNQFGIAVAFPNQKRLLVRNGAK